MGRYICDILKKYTKIVVWGTGNYYSLYNDLLDERVLYFVDNNAEKWGGLLDQKNIFPPKKLIMEDINDTLIIVCSHCFDEISIQIKQYGDFDIIDILTMKLVDQREKELLTIRYLEEDRYILVLGGIHAMWQTNGSRKFIDGQLEQLHQAGFNTIEITPLLYYEEGKRETFFLAVSINGIYQGIFSSNELISKYPRVKGMIIHSLYYSQETMKYLLDFIVVATRVLYYIHDYSCLCIHRFLHKSKKSCIGTDGSLICDTCGEDKEHRKLLDFHRSVFEKYNVILVAPSVDTKTRVEAFYKNIEIVEIPHLIFERDCCKNKINNRIRIAYVGTAIWHKGWEQFSKLVDRLCQKFDFYCLGDCPDDMRIQNVFYIPVELKGSGHVLTMTEALLQYDIDIVYIGSIWPETYSYTYYEAYEAGCFILTNVKSGNVSNQVILNQNGLSFSDDNEMMAWLENAPVQEVIQNLSQRIINVQSNKEYLKYFK